MEVYLVQDIQQEAVMVSDKFVDQFVTALESIYAGRDEQPTISVSNRIVRLDFRYCSVKIDLNLERQTLA